jgi:hypothetical protein
MPAGRVRCLSSDFRPPTLPAPLAYILAREGPA